MFTTYIYIYIHTFFVCRYVIYDMITVLVVLIYIYIYVYIYIYIYIYIHTYTYTTAVPQHGAEGGAGRLAAQPVDERARPPVVPFYLLLFLY